MATQVDPIGCQDGCKRTVKDRSEAEAKAWTYLEISRRWRCPQCVRDLEQANNRSGGYNEKT